MRIGVDIGATKISGGLIDPEGGILARFRLQSKGYEDARLLARAVAEEIRRLLSEKGVALSDMAHFGIGIPGTADWRTGRILYSSNLFGENVPLADYIEKELGLRPTIVQDSWAGAYAEYAFGQKKKLSDMMCITLGTGIGCGIIRDGKVFAGAMGTAGEIGHVSIDPNGRPCSCGKNGCLETYASGTGIFSQAMALFPQKLKSLPQKAESVFALAEAGDQDAQDLLCACADRLSFGLAALMDIMACGTVFISGGLSCHEKWFVDPLPEAIGRYGYPAWSKRFTPVVKRAALGDDAPLIGAAFLDGEHIF